MIIISMGPHRRGLIEYDINGSLAYIRHLEGRIDDPQFLDSSFTTHHTLLHSLDNMGWFGNDSDEARAYDQVGCHPTLDVQLVTDHA